jgi:hypothetical protein
MSRVWDYPAKEEMIFELNHSQNFDARNICSRIRRAFIPAARIISNL